jgi:hypothetical protein
MTSPAQSPIPAAYTDNTVLIPADWDYPQWETEAKSLQRSHRSMSFWLGDLFIWGEARFGEDFSQAVDTHSEETVRRAMRVCRKFPPERRRACGFSFHQRIESFEPADQDEILDLAVKHDWRREQLDEEIARRRMARSTVGSPEPQSKHRLGEGTPDPAANGGSDPAAAQPSPSSPNWTDEAAALLQQVAPAVLPTHIAAAVGLILKERALLRRIAALAAQSVIDDALDPSLSEALTELRRLFP